MNERMIKTRRLNEQVRKTLEGMAKTQNKIADLEEKISRLEEASSNLDSSILEVESFKSSILDLAIDPKKWKGEEYKDFEDVYDSYRENTKEYVLETEDAKEAIDDDIRRYQAELDSAINYLTNYEISLEEIHNQLHQ